MHACQKRKGERAFVIPSEFEPAVSQWWNCTGTRLLTWSTTVKKVSHFSDVTGKRRLLRALRLLSEWRGVAH